MYNLDVNDGYEYVITSIEAKLDEFAPVKHIVIKPDHKFHEAWLTVKMKKYNNKCRKLCDKARRSGKVSDFERYRNYRNILNRLKWFEKRMHYKQLFTKIGKNSKLLWNIVNNIVKKSNNRHEIPTLLYENTVYSAEPDICNALNSHFATAGKRTQQSIPSTTGVLF